MFRIFRRRHGHHGHMDEGALAPEQSYAEKTKAVRDEVEAGIVEHLQQAGVQIAAEEQAAGRVTFPNAAGAVNAACKAAAFTTSELVVTQRRLQVARAANQRLAKQMAALEKRTTQESDVQVALAEQEAEHARELARLQARNARLAASLEAMVAIAEGYQVAEHSREEELMLERDANAVQIEQLESKLEEMARSRGMLRSIHAEVNAQRDAAMAELGLAPASSKGSSRTTSDDSADSTDLRPPPARVHSLAPEPSSDFEVATGEAASTASGPVSLGAGPSAPAAENGVKSPEKLTAVLQRQMHRMRKDFRAEVRKRGEVEVELLATKAALQRAEKLVEALSASVKEQERSASAPYVQGTTEAKGVLHEAPAPAPAARSTSAPSAIAVSSVASSSAPITPTNGGAPHQDQVIRASGTAEPNRVLRSPQRRSGYQPTTASGETPDEAGGPTRALEFDAKAAMEKEMNQADADAAVQAMAMEGETEFNVRGPNYLSDRVKVPAGRQIAKMLHVDFFKSEGRLDHVMARGPAAASEMNRADRFLFVVNIQIPGAPFVNAVVYFGIPKDVLPEALCAEVGESAEVSEADILAEMGLEGGGGGAAEEKQGAAPPPVLESFKALLAAFCSDSDGYRDGRFKLVPAVIDAPWVVRRAVGNRPTIVGRKLKNRYFRGDGYIEVDIDISSSSVATSVLALVRDYAKCLTVEVGFLIESQKADELPETMIGVVRFDKVDFNLAVKELPPDADGDADAES